MSRFTPGITIFANIAFVMFCLKQLLHNTAQIDVCSEYRFVKDKFQSREEGQNWNYDFVIVTSIKDEGISSVDDLQRKTLRGTSRSGALENADLETEQYKSRKFDKVFIKIRASRERLEEEV